MQNEAPLSSRNAVLLGVVKSLQINTAPNKEQYDDDKTLPTLLKNKGEQSTRLAFLLRQMMRNSRHLFLLTQLQGDIGNRAPTYLRDLIGRLSTFSDEPRLAGLVGLVVTMVMDMAYTSSKQSSGVKGKLAGSSSCQVCTK